MERHVISWFGYKDVMGLLIMNNLGRLSVFRLNISLSFLKMKENELQETF